MRRHVFLPVLAAFASACQTAGGTGTSPPVTVTVTRTVPPPGTAAPTGTGGPSGTGRPSASAAEKLRVPDVVGMNHQEAQDRLQELGFHRLTEEDATGRNRLLLWDRHWVVVGQSPPPGSRVSPDTRIILRSKKPTD